MYWHAVTHFLNSVLLFARPYFTVGGWHYISCGQGLGSAHSSTRLGREIGIPESSKPCSISKYPTCPSDTRVLGTTSMQRCVLIHHYFLGILGRVARDARGGHTQQVEDGVEIGAFHHRAVVE